jgi:hypothetical protein
MDEMKYQPSEVEVARWVIRFLESLEWDVYQEVSGHPGRADIVARRGTVVWVVEVKTSFTLSVLEQAHRWLPHAHMVSVATPRWPGAFGKDLCRMLGLGIISASQQYGDGSGTKEQLRPKLNRKPWKIPKLCEEQKTYAAAGSNSGYFSPFQRTCRLVMDHLRGENPVTMKKLVDLVDHHYCSDASARQSLKTWIDAGKIKGVETYIHDRKLCVRLSMK